MEKDRGLRGIVVSAILIFGGCSSSADNADPTISILEPSAPMLSAPGSTLQIDYVDDDSDDMALTSLYADIDGDLATTNDQIAIELDRPDGDGAAQSVMWDTTGVASGAYTILAVTADGSNAPASASAAGVVTINVPPTVSVTGPASDVRAVSGSMVPLDYSDNDPDDSAVTDLFADADGDLTTTNDQFVIATGRPELDGASQIVDWDTTGVPVGSYSILIVVSDGTFSPVQAASAGKVIVADAISDDFGDGVIDSALWEVLRPFAGSDATESGGSLNLSARPYVATVDEWNPSAEVPLEVEFDWTPGTSISHLNLLTRSDATWAGQYAESSGGVGVNFSVQEGSFWGYSTQGTGVVSGMDFGANTYSFVPGTTYRIRLVDDSKSLSLFIDDMNTPVAVGTIADVFTTNRVVFYNREFGAVDAFDNFRISGLRVPRAP
jgi:hypothetical protein